MQSQNLLVFLLSATAATAATTITTRPTPAPLADVSSEQMLKCAEKMSSLTIAMAARPTPPQLESIIDAAGGNPCDVVRADLPKNLTADYDYMMDTFATWFDNGKALESCPHSDALLAIVPPSCLDKFKARKAASPSPSSSSSAAGETSRPAAAMAFALALGAVVAALA